MNRLDSFRAPSLIGRDAELERLEQAVAGARAGRGGAVFIEGALGIGKTRLGNELAGFAQRAGGLCLTARAFAVESGLPYALFQTALRSLDSDAADAEQDPLAAIFTRLAPGGPTARPRVLASAGEESRARAALCETFAAALRRSAGRRPLVLFLDDLHWADPHSLALLHVVIRQVGGTQALVVATYREEDAAANHTLREVVRSIEQIGLAERIALRPLSPAQAETLIKQVLHYQDDLSPSFLELLYQHTEGNPLFLEETLRALATQGDIYLQGGRWQRRPIRSLQAPPTLRDALLLRLADVSEPDLQVLEAAASIGPEFDYDLLRRASGVEQDQLDATLTTLCRGRLLTEVAAPGLRFRFAQSLLHTALYASLTEAMRRRHHRHIAAALDGETETGGARVWASLAWHTARADTPDGWHGRSARLIDAAEQAWRSGNLLDASRIYDSMLTHPDGRLPREDVQTGWMRLGDVRAWSGDLTGARDAWQRALAGEQPAGSGAALHARIAALRWDEGDAADAVEHFRATIAALDAAPHETVAAALVRLARVLCDQRYWQEAEHLSERAGAAAEATRDRALAAEARALLAYARTMRNEREGAASAEQRALALANARTGPVGRWQAYQLLAALADLRGDWRRALDHLAAGERLGEPARLPSLQARANALSGIVLAHSGRWAEALAALGRAIDAEREMGLWGALPSALAEAALLHYERGNAIVAREYLDEARALVEAHLGSDSPAFVPVMLALGQVSLESGYPEQARTYARRAAGALGCARCAGLAIAAVFALHARAGIALGDLPAAERALLALQRVAWDKEHLPSMGDYWEGRGRLALARDDAAGAADAFAESAALGEALRAAGDPGAPTALEHAWVLLEPLGAQVALKRVRRALGVLGVVARHAKPRPHSGDVTERERELIALIGRRYSTDQIAERLVISPATVRTHLRNVFRKLGVSSRGELIRVAQDRGLLVV